MQLVHLTCSLAYSLARLFFSYGTAVATRLMRELCLERSFERSLANPDGLLREGGRRLRLPIYAL